MRTALVKIRGETVKVYYRAEYPRNSGVNYDWWFGGDDVARFRDLTTAEEEQILALIAEGDKQ